MFTAWPDATPCLPAAARTGLSAALTPGGAFGRGGRDAEVTYEDGIFVGYRHYATKGAKVAYPFGFGLSYTTFAYSDLKLSGKEFGTGLIATVTITNTGKVAGRKAVQLYLSAPGTSMPKPARTPSRSAPRPRTSA